MKTLLRILVVEDSEDDVLLVLRQIKKGEYDIQYERVQTAETMKTALYEKTWDIILSDYQMPNFNGLEALNLLKESGIDIPFIIISGIIGEEVAVEVMKAGAHDYIMKNNLQRLLPAIERELRDSKNRTERKLLEYKHKQAEEALYESEKRYRRITEGLTDYLYTVRFENGRIVKTTQSQTCAIITGYTPEEFAADPFLWFRMIFPDDRELVKERIQQIQAGKHISPIEHRIIRKDGSIRWVCDTTILFKDANDQLLSYDGVIKDITERKQAEEALHESEERFRRLAENALDVIYRMSLPDGKYEYVSPAALSVFGYSPEECYKTPNLIKQAIHPDWRKYFEEQWANLIKGYMPPTYEYQFINKSGEIRWLNQRNILVRDDTGIPIAIEGIVTDITKRKQTEMEIVHMNRTLHMLSDVNQALIRITDEATLLNKVCQIVVEEGGYRLAWVAFVVHDEAKTLHPVAHAGFDSGYIKSAKLTWEDNERGQGPGGIAIRTGQPCIAQNILLDPTFAPWREAAIQRGYKSIIALPLINENLTLGVLGIYSTETDAFDTQEVEILKELASDLAFGITSLRIKDKKSQAEEALRASEERFSAVFRFSPLAIAIFRANDGCIVDANEVFIKTSGYSRDEIIGHTTTELGLYANPLDRDIVIKKLQEQGVVESFEFETHSKSGEIRTMISAITYIHIKRVEHYLALILDITERKKSEERLRLLSTALEATANAIMITEKNAKIIWANDAFSKLTGYTLDEAIGHNPSELVNSGVQSKDFFKDMWKTILDARVWSGEIINRRKDGSLYNEYLTITPVPNQEGSITHFIAVKQDITERKQFEKVLQDSERKYRIVADNTYNWEFWTDPKGNFIYCSPSCFRISGYTAAEFIDNSNLKFEIIHADYRSLFNEHFHRDVEDKSIVSIQYKIIHKNGSERWIEHVCQPVFDTEDNYMGFRGSNCDITEKKETDRKILNAIISTEELERNKFSQELHDGLGPMLSTVKLYFQWLAETSDREKQKGITTTGIQNIDDAIQTLREISNNLSPRILINTGLVMALKYLIQRINETNKLLIEFTFDEGRRYNSQTEITLYRIISELLNNTIKYAKATTILINLSNNYNKNLLILTYSDNGKGFDLNKVIENKKGMGLLNMMQRVATLKGLINFDTEERKGLIVRIELPLLNKEQS